MVSNGRSETKKIVGVVVVIMAAIQLIMSPLGRDVVLVLQTITLLSIVFIALKGNAKWWGGGLILMWVSVSLFNYNHLDMSISPDAVRYRDYFDLFKYNPSAYISSVYEEVVNSNYYDLSSYSFVGLVFYPVAFIANGADIDTVFLILNFLFALGTALFYWLAADRVAVEYKQEKKIAVLIWVFSPVVVYHYQVFSKDILSCFLCALSVFFFSRKKIIMSIFWVVLASMLRPYSLAIVFSMFYFLSDDRRKLALGVGASLIVVFAVAGINGIINSLIVLFYMPISPNVFSFNIERYDYIPLYAESFFFLVGILFFLVAFFFSFKVRRFSLHCLLALFIYSCVMTVLGKYISDYHDIAYEVGSMGNNALRKKIPVLSIYISMILVGISFFKVKGNRFFVERKERCK